MAGMAGNITVARMANIARQYGTTTGMMGCSIQESDRAYAIFSLTRGYVFVEIDGEQHTSGWLLDKATALAYWERYWRSKLTKNQENHGTEESGHEARRSTGDPARLLAD